jgi:hypothetical protein
MRRTVIALSFMLALAFVVVPTSVSASADRIVTLTLKCQKFSCEGDWTWCQGGTSCTQLGSGRINGDYGTSSVRACRRCNLEMIRCRNGRLGSSSTARIAWSAIRPTSLPRCVMR